MNVIASEWMSKWSANGMNVIVLHELRVQHRLKTELFSVAMKHLSLSLSLSLYIYIYTHYDRSLREREKIGIKSVHLEDCFQLQFDWPEWIERTQTTSNRQHKPTTLHIMEDQNYLEGV